MLFICLCREVLIAFRKDSQHNNTVVQMIRKCMVRIRMRNNCRGGIVYLIIPHDVNIHVSITFGN